MSARSTRLAEEYAGRLYSVAYRMLGNRADAEDAVQRALLKCFAARASYSPRWAVSTWLYRALTNVCIDELRRRRVRNEADLDPRRSAEDAPPTARRRRAGSRTAASGRAHRPDAGAGHRPPRGADAAGAALRGRARLRELAKVRGISVNTVKSQLARGKAILKKALEAGGHDGSD